MSELLFLPEGWADYTYWQTQDRKTLRRINLIIQDILRDEFSGLGKPEPLRGDMSGWWSRRIDDDNRLIYRARMGRIEIAQCRGHYGEH